MNRTVKSIKHRLKKLGIKKTKPYEYIGQMFNKLLINNISLEPYHIPSYDGNVTFAYCTFSCGNNIKALFADIKREILLVVVV